jgi:hypothetical protein
MNAWKTLTTFAGVLLYAATWGHAQTWTKLTNVPPASLATGLQLTDGTIACNHYNNGSWSRLTPDASGSYVNGTWSSMATMPSGYAPLYYASAVLADGRMYVVGGEYNNGSQVWTNLGAIYNPVANTWAALNAPFPAGQVGDTQSVVFPNGKMMISNITNTQVALLDPATLTFSLPGSANKADRNDEEGWTLLPNGNILVVNCIASPGTQIYNLSAQAWTNAGNTGTVNLEDGASQEMGPAVLRPDGTVMAFGATGHNAVYNTISGTWVNGPDFPNIGGQLDVADGPAALLPDGNVLVGASPGVFNTGTHYYEWDGNALNPVAGPPRAGSDSSYQGRMVVLPTGQILFTDGSTDVEVYTASGTYSPSWQPTITAFPSAIQTGSTYTISGTQFNGLSLGAAYGDDAQTATNYPLARLTDNNGHVYYLRTHDHSTMAVATGSAIVSTNFDVPSNVPSGSYSLVVVANGIPSAPVTVQLTNLSPDFTIGAAPPSQSITRGQTATYTVTIGALNGFSGTVTLSAAGLPKFTKATFNPATVTGSGTSTLTITTQKFLTKVGTYTVTATGTSGTITHSAQVTLTIGKAPDDTAPDAPPGS